MSRFSIYISANSQIYDISYERFLSAHSAQPPVKLEVLEKPSSDTFTCSKIELFSFKPSQFTCALWLLMPARHEKIIGESDWGAALPTNDSHLSGDIEKTSATWPRGMFTAPGIAPSDANSLGWRTYLLWCKRLAWNLSHVYDQNIFWDQGSA